MFGIAFAYDQAPNRRLKICDTDLTLLYTGDVGMSTTDVAVNRNGDVVYLCESNVLKGRSLTNGSLLYTEFESVGAQRALFVDYSDCVWTIDLTKNKVLRRWSANLSSRTDYTLKTGNYQEDKITYIAMTFDGLYMYVLGGDSTVNRLSKYAVANLDGGNSEWDFDYNSIPAGMHFAVVSPNTNAVYLCDLASSGGRVIGISNAGVALFGSAIYGYGLPAIVDNKLYIVGMTPDGVGIAKAKQLSALDGSIVGSTKTDTMGVNALPRCCHIYSSDVLFITHYDSAFGGNASGVYKFEIDDDWSLDTEDDVDSYVTPQTQHFVYGDATGYIHSLLIALVPAAGFSGTPTSGTRNLGVTFADESTGGAAISWLWDFGDGDTSVEQNPVHTFAEPGKYDVSLTVTTILGLTDTETKEEYISVQVDDPVASENTGDYTNFLEVALTCTTENASIYYTLDGSTPSEASSLYTGLIPIYETKTLKAKAYKTDCDPSNVVTYTYTLTIDHAEMNAYCFFCGQRTYNKTLTNNSKDSAHRRDYFHNCGREELKQRTRPDEQLEKYSHANRNRR
jgi:PKD repeat protein